MSSTEDIQSTQERKGRRREEGGVDRESKREKERETEADQTLHTGKTG